MNATFNKLLRTRAQEPSVSFADHNDICRESHLAVILMMRSSKQDKSEKRLYYLLAEMSEPGRC